jgi:hypothetical protein
METTLSGMKIYPCCSHCHNHEGPWFGSETLVYDLETGEIAGHNEPCAQCQTPTEEA